MPGCARKRRSAGADRAAWLGRARHRGARVIYLHPIGWALILVAGVAGTLAAVGIARVMGGEGQRASRRRLATGVLAFVPAPLLMGGATAVVPAWLYLVVAPAVLAKQGIGPLVAAEEGRAVPLGWGAALTRGVAFATASVLAFLIGVDVIARVAA